MLIATRHLVVRTDGREVTVEIRLFKPQLDGEALSCRYEIDWPSGTRKSRAAGVDDIQAILLALKKIGIELYTSAYHKSGQLEWLTAGSGYGFPVTSNVRDLLVGEDRDM